MELQRTPGELAKSKAARSTKAKKRGAFTRGSIPRLVRGTCLVPKAPNFKAKEDIQRLHLRELLSLSHPSQPSPACALNHSLLVISQSSHQRRSGRPGQTPRFAAGEAGRCQDSKLEPSRVPSSLLCKPWRLSLGPRHPHLENGHEGACLTHFAVKRRVD